MMNQDKKNAALGITGAVVSCALLCVLSPGGVLENPGLVLRLVVGGSVLAGFAALVANAGPLAVPRRH